MCGPVSHCITSIAASRTRLVLEQHFPQQHQRLSPQPTHEAVLVHKNLGPKARRVRTVEKNKARGSQGVWLLESQSGNIIVFYYFIHHFLIKIIIVAKSLLFGQLKPQMNSDVIHHRTHPLSTFANTWGSASVSLPPFRFHHFLTSPETAG